MKKSNSHSQNDDSLDIFEEILPLDKPVHATDSIQDILNKGWNSSFISWLLLPIPIILHLRIKLILKKYPLLKSMREGLLYDISLVRITTFTYILMVIYLSPFIRELIFLFLDYNNLDKAWLLINSWYTVQTIVVLVVHLSMTHWAIKSFTISYTFFDQQKTLKAYAQIRREVPISDLLLYSSLKEMLPSIMANAITSIIIATIAERPDSIEYIPAFMKILINQVESAFMKSEKLPSETVKAMTDSMNRQLVEAKAKYGEPWNDQ